MSLPLELYQKSSITKICHSGHLPSDRQVPQNFRMSKVQLYRVRFGAQFVRTVPFDLLGREVQVPINDQKIAGSHYAKFNGQGLASGIYFIRAEIGNKSSKQKILFIK